MPEDVAVSKDYAVSASFEWPDENFRPLPPAPEAEVPKVIVLTPYYGAVAMGLLGAIRFAIKDHRLIEKPTEVQSSSSILPHGFNQLLSAALDARDAGTITHMAMCHADIVPEPGWLDLLWSEMWFRNADLVSAVVPIKGMSGRTSTAIGSTDDRWHIRRCVYMHQRKEMPATFGPEDVCTPGEVLLVNTGLFLADLRRPYWDDFAFEFHTRIRKGKDGKRIAECRSEDWEMSHHLHDAGARVLATWKVRLQHEGVYGWPNYEMRREQMA